MFNRKKPVFNSPFINPPQGTENVPDSAHVWVSASDAKPVGDEWSHLQPSRLTFGEASRRYFLGEGGRTALGRMSLIAARMGKNGAASMLGFFGVVNDAAGVGIVDNVPISVVVGLTAYKTIKEIQEIRGPKH